MSRSEDITLNQNTDAKIKLFVVGSSGDPLDISTKLFSASIKKNYYDAEDTSIDFSSNIEDAAGGVITISLSSAQTANMDPSKRYLYDVMMYESGNTNIQKILEGKVFVKPSVTVVGV